LVTDFAVNCFIVSQIQQTPRDSFTIVDCIRIIVIEMNFLIPIIIKRVIKANLIILINCLLTDSLTQIKTFTIPFYDKDLSATILIFITSSF
jgi:hypothetical protein